MAKVRFEDGTVIAFDGTPTPEDVEFAYAQIKGGMSQAPPAPQRDPAALDRFRIPILPGGFTMPVKDVPQVAGQTINAMAAGLPKFLTERNLMPLPGMEFTPPGVQQQIARQLFTQPPSSPAGQMAAGMGTMAGYGVGLPGAGMRGVASLMPRMANRAVGRMATGAAGGLLTDIPEEVQHPEVAVARGVGGAVLNVALPPLIERIGKGFRGKRLATVDEVLQTPEERLPKLTKRQQEAYFHERGQRIKQEFSRQQTALKAEQAVLGKELGKAATQRSLTIRQQLPALYSRQSSHYRALVDRELAPVANDLVPDEELRAYLLKRFASDPEKLNAVSQRFGLINEPASLAEGMPPPEFRIGELYQKSLSLGQTLPRAVRESQRVYTPTEEATDEAIATLVDFLETKGVNLKEARGFWRSWAPIRNQATREFKPFITPDVNTQTGSRRLIALAKGMDPDNEVYAKSLAQLLGIEDLPGELTPIVRRLQTTQKTMLATKLQQDEASGALRQLQFQIGQLTDQRLKRLQVGKWLLQGVVGAAGAGGAYSLWNLLHE